MAIIDADGLFHGERLAACSDLAQALLATILYRLKWLRTIGTIFYINHF